MSRIPTIPDFAKTLDDIDATLRTVKLCLEILGGLRQGETLGAPLVFVQGHTPSLENAGSYRRGDLWIDDSVDKLNYWDGQGWRRIL